MRNFIICRPAAEKVVTVIKGSKKIKKGEERS
jgi:hypothetical protein